MGEGLSASQPSVGRADRTGRGEHGAVSVKHDEGGVLIGEPAERRERHHAIGSDYNETPKTMPNAREWGFSAGDSDPIPKYQVTAINVYFDSVSEQSHNALSWRKRTG